MVTPGLEDNSAILDALASAAAQVAAEATIQAVQGQLEELIQKAGTSRANIDMTVLERAVAKATRSVTMRRAKGQDVDTNLIEAVVRSVLQEEERGASGASTSRRQFRNDVTRYADPHTRPSRGAMVLRNPGEMEIVAAPQTGMVRYSPGSVMSYRKGGYSTSKYNDRTQVSQDGGQGRRRRRTGPKDIPEQDLAGDDIYEGLETKSVSDYETRRMSVNRAFFDNNPKFAQSMGILNTGQVDLEAGFREPGDIRQDGTNRAFISPVEDAIKEAERRRNVGLHQQRQQSYEASRWGGIYGGAAYGAGSFLSQAGIPGGGAMGRMASMFRAGGQMGVGMSMAGIGQGKLVKNPETGRMMMQGGMNMAGAVPALGAFVGAISLGTQGIKMYTENMMLASEMTLKYGLQGSGGVWGGYGKGTTQRKEMGNIKFATSSFFDEFEGKPEQKQADELLRSTMIAVMGKRFGLDEFQDVNTAKYHVLGAERATQNPATQPAALQYMQSTFQRAGMEDSVASALAGASAMQGGFVPGFQQLGGVKSLENMSATERQHITNQMMITHGVGRSTANKAMRDVFGAPTSSTWERMGADISNMFDSPARPGFLGGVNDIGQFRDYRRHEPEYQELLEEIRKLRGSFENAFVLEGG